MDLFWTAEINDIRSRNEDPDVESDDELNDELDGGNTNDYDSDQEHELNDHLETINNVTTSTYHGIRLSDAVKSELSHTFFKVNINNENKFLHKQAACWMLEKDKSSLSADRLSRVTGR